MKQLIIPDILKIGEHYSNDQIKYALEVSNLGGIRPKIKDKELDFIVLITSAEETKNVIRNPYADKIEEDVLIYTGAGLKGDQEISGVNKRLLEQKDKPVPILGFLKEAVNQYKFIGFLFMLRNYQDYQLDNEGNLRKVWLFEFQIFSDISPLKIGNLNDSFLPFYNQFKKEILPEDTIIGSLFPEKYQDEIILPRLDEKTLKSIELLKKNLLTINPYEFEVLMSKLIEHAGFMNVKVTKKSGDDGIDVNAFLKHRFSFDLSYQFQVKRWKHSVGRKEVANLRGSLGFNSFGVIISTSHFTSSAINESQGIGKTPINLVGMKDLYEIIREINFTF
ncbi:MAG: restriction endonuclease [Candidatus Moranbacteria bacterium]|nr:restriction endonuclease [Candidatus Moranbacteria bacterium]